ncbi:response regulator [Flavobacterium psychroterrae]|nr:DNA-binding response regulator [Flavobacterium psychroterrae]
MGVLFRSENIEDGLSKLSTLKQLPKACIIDLNFHDKNVLARLQELKTKYTAIKLIAHTDIDTEKTIRGILKIGFESFLLVGSDRSVFIKAIEKVRNG